MNHATPIIDAHWREGSEPTAWSSDDCCDLCCAVPVREIIDGDRMCQSCCDAWARAEGAAIASGEADLVPLSHPVMQAAFKRISDAELQHIAGGHRRFERLERRHSKRSGR